MKPLIGITTNYIKDDQFGVATHIGGSGQSWHALADDYVSAVAAAGGISVLLPVLPNPQQAQEYLEQLDGVIFSGGCDISPLTYAEDCIGQVGEICAERDEQELCLLRRALDLPEFPVLGICRGCQLLNVVQGGSLIQDMQTQNCGEHFFAQQRMSAPTHRVNIEPDSRLAKILQKEDRVNSYHHQCVSKVGAGLVVSARDDHGIPECIELAKNDRFVLGTQWHPEGLALKYEGHLNIFKAFVQAAADYKAGGK